MSQAYSWEQAVLWLREQPDQTELVRDCYYDDPLKAAAERYAASPEWRAVEAILPATPGLALDLGAGRGISSFALAQAGWSVTALEPDPSPLVGAGAIRCLAADTELAIDVIEDYAEAVPCSDASFDLVYGRQVLHHPRDLTGLCREAGRVLKPGGRLIATREHVISRPQDLAAFLEWHPLHRLYGGENAFTLAEYRRAIRVSRLRLVTEMGPFDSPINLAPLTTDGWRSQCEGYLTRLIGRQLAHLLLDARRPWGNAMLHTISVVLSRVVRTPGRLYSFVADKPQR